MTTLHQYIEKMKEEFVEKGADFEHDRWARWQKYMFSKGTVDTDGVFHLPKEFVDRWFPADRYVILRIIRARKGK